jgi:hypothetical protein
MIKFNFIIFLIISVFAVGSCRFKTDKEEKNGKTESINSSFTDILIDFSATNFGFVTGYQLSIDELIELLDRKETKDWKIEIPEARNNQILFLNKEYPDISIALTVYQDQNGILLVVTEQNGSNNESRLWKKMTGSKEWLTIDLPQFQLVDFISEKAKVPSFTYSDDAYLAFHFYEERIECTLGNKLFFLELDESYSTYEKNFIKYKFDIFWTGKFLEYNKIQLDKFTDVFEFSAAIVKDEPTEDGPGAMEFLCPAKVSVKASSNLDNQGNSNYEIDNILVDDRRIWSEGVNGPGIGEWIEFSIDDESFVEKHYIIKNGNTKDKNSWKSNHRVKRFKVFWNQNFLSEISLHDTDELQEFLIMPTWAKDFLTMKAGDKIRFEITEVYQGEKYDDTVISYFVPTTSPCG